MIDVHILTLPDTNKFFLEKCIESFSGQGSGGFITSGIQGDTAAARTLAFQQGENPYVAFVDPDDVLMPDIFTKLQAILEANPDAVCAYSDEILIDIHGNKLQDGWSINPEPFLRNGFDLRCHEVNGQYIHHLRLFRRSAVEKCLPLKTKRMPEPVLMHELSKLGKLIHLPEVGYQWRIHGENTFPTYTKEEVDEAMEIIRGIHERD